MGASSVQVPGARLDDETRCVHWGSELDVVAFQLKCCRAFYPCRACHDETADHEAEVWGPDELDTAAVLCGACRTTMAIDAYVACEHTCPACQAPFNPGCADHWERYFHLE